MGRHRYSDRLKVEDCHILDVWHLNSAGILKPDAVLKEYIFYEKTTNGHRRAFGCFVERDDDERIRLVVGHKTYGTVFENMIRRVAEIDVVWERNPLVGGERAYMLCPADGCGRKVRKLYQPPYQFDYRCRHCWDLTYESRRHRNLDETLKRLEIELAAFAAHYDFYGRNLDKPKETGI